MERWLGPARMAELASRPYLQEREEREREKERDGELRVRHLSFEFPISRNPIQQKHTHTQEISKSITWRELRSKFRSILQNSI